MAIPGWTRPNPPVAISEMGSYGQLNGLRIPRIHIQGTGIIFGHMHSHVSCPFLSLLNHFLYLCFESSSKLAELGRDQMRGKVSGLAPDYSISQGCCEGGGANGESTMATLVVWRPYVRGQLAELCSSHLDLIKPFSLN